MSARTRLGGDRSRRWRIEGEAPGGPVHPTRARERSKPRRTTRILFINQYYWPDHASTAQHLTDLAETMAAEGHECVVVCSRGRYRAGPASLPRRETRLGVQIRRIGATSFGRRTTLGRMTDYLTFYVGALLLALRMRRFDAVVTLTTPPIIGLVGLILTLLKGTRHVTWSMDLHPEAGVALGRMAPGHPVIAALAKLSHAVYRRADRVVVLGPYMADRVAAKGVRPGRIVEIPVWSRADEVYPLPRDGHPLRERLGLGGKFVAMYSGNLGLAHGFDEFLAAARTLRDRADIVFLFVGDGPRLAEVRAAKDADGLANVHLMDYVPRDQLHTSLSLADVHLISMRREMTGLVVPGKLYGAMASGRPALFVGPDHCETADTIRKADCGLTVRQGDASGVVAAIEKLAADPDLVRSLGDRGRASFLAEFEREGCCARWSALLGELLAPATASAPAPLPAPKGPRPRRAKVGLPRITGSY